jgi:hypothetical protein
MPDLSATPSTKRVVLEHKTGRLAGLFQILGTTDDAPKPLPTVVKGVERAGDTSCTSQLIAVKDRFAHYKEIA